MFEGSWKGGSWGNIQQKDANANGQKVSRSWAFDNVKRHKSHKDQFTLQNL